MSVGITMLKNAYRAQRLDRCDCISCNPETTETLRRENERLREALEKIATVNAMDYEYVRWARAALQREEVK